MVIAVHLLAIHIVDFYYLTCHSIYSDKFNMLQPLTSNFIHIDRTHFINNLFLLFTLSILLSNGKNLLMFTISLISSYLTCILSSFYYNYEDFTSMGSSTLVYSLMGLYIVKFLSKKSINFFDILVSFLIMLIFIDSLVKTITHYGVQEGEVIIGHFSHTSSFTIAFILGIFIKVKKKFDKFFVFK